MIRIALVSLCAMTVAGCDPAKLVGDVDQPEVSCATQPAGGCTFDQAPLRVLDEPVTLPRRPYTFFPIAKTLNFVDARGRRWVAPARTLTDGASIPQIFTSIIGDPTAPEFINAAAVHDAYCGVGNEQGPKFHDGTWQDVHRMFYDGLIVGGTGSVQAKLMFAAVWLGGPRWNTHQDLSHVPTARKQAAMRAAQNFINNEDPPLPELEAYLLLLQRGILKDYPVGGSSEESAEYPVEEQYYEEFSSANDPSLGL